jgi:hypothetical protein
MKTHKILLSAPLCLSLSLCLGAGAFAQQIPNQDSNSKPDSKALSAELASFLNRQGDFCLGKFDWPIDVTESDAQVRTRDAVQMPVLEKIGLVVSTSGTVMRKVDETEKPVPVIRYALTDAGKAFYLQKDAPGSDTGAGPVRRHDLCAGRLSLDKLVSWTEPVVQGDHQALTATYTYRFAAAKWGMDPEVQRVFPVLARVIHGEGTLQLTQVFQWKDGKWVASNAAEAVR